MPRPGRLTALLLCLALFASPLSPATADQPDERAAATAAVAALAQVESIFGGSTLTTDRAGDERGSATLALRDLALLVDDLPPDLRQRAASYFARPTAPPRRCPDASCYRTRRVHRVCTAALCVHYVRRADDDLNGVPPRDRDGDRRPDYVEKVLTSLTRVHRRYVRAGYRRPLGDGRRGGDARPDVYLAQIGDWGLYGYCTTALGQESEHGGAWAYCVLDNDYRRNEFPQHTPIQNMQVTAAHEYFHAVQFGYDVAEDGWFMEATATWVEDEVYDRVDDNVGYLPQGPMGQYADPLDTARNGYYYGAWIFFRHVTEAHPESRAGLPVVVRTMWEYADARRLGSPNLYSMAAVEQTLADHGTTLTDQFLHMAAANLHPRRWYDEGELYPTTPFLVRRTLTPTRPDWEDYLLQDHLSSASYRFDPHPGMTARDWTLRVTLDLAPPARGSAALVRVALRSGGTHTVVAALSDTGAFEGTVPFSSIDVKGVEVVLVNASSRYNCEVRTGWSCHGRPLDQDLIQGLRVRAERNA